MVAIYEICGGVMMRDREEKKKDVEKGFALLTTTDDLHAGESDRAIP
jgi:hypothetical protein